MPFAYLHIFPILTCISMMTAIISSFILAYESDHVTTAAPYISDGAATAPESCIFAQLLYLATLFYIVVLYIRFLQIQLVCYTHEELKKNKTHILNIICLILGIIGCLGNTIGADFPTLGEHIVHHIGSGIGMAALSVNLHVNTFISFRTSQILQYPFILKWLRLCLSYMLILNLILYISFRIYAEIIFKGTHEDMLHWYSTNKGWMAHTISAVCEYVSQLLTILYIFTFTCEFSYIEISEPYVVSRDIENLETRGPSTARIETKKTSTINIEKRKTVQKNQPKKT